MNTGDAGQATAFNLPRLLDLRKADACGWLPQRVRALVGFTCFRFGCLSAELQRRQVIFTGGKSRLSLLQSTGRFLQLAIDLKRQNGIGSRWSNQLSKRSTAFSAAGCKESGFVVLFVMAWSPVRRFNAG
jgi:hypothetical protein